MKEYNNANKPSREGVMPLLYVEIFIRDCPEQKAYVRAIKRRFGRAVVHSGFISYERTSAVGVFVRLRAQAPSARQLRQTLKKLCPLPCSIAISTERPRYWDLTLD